MASQTYIQKTNCHRRSYNSATRCVCKLHASKTGVDGSPSHTSHLRNAITSPCKTVNMAHKYIPVCKLRRGSLERKFAKRPHGKWQELPRTGCLWNGQAWRMDQCTTASSCGTRALIVLECASIKKLPKSPAPVQRGKCHALTLSPNAASKLPMLFLG